MNILKLLPTKNRETQAASILMLLWKTPNIVMTALNCSADPSWHFYLVAVSSSEQDIDGLKFFPLLREWKEKPSSPPHACILNVKYLNWGVGGVYCLNYFQRSNFKIRMNRCSGTSTNKFSDDSLLWKSGQHCLIYTCQYGRLSGSHY